MFGRVASLFVTDEALSVSDVLRPIARREIDLVDIHGVWISLRGSARQRNVAVSSSSKFPESYYVSIEFPSFVQPLFPLPVSLSVREGGGGHHDSELLGYSSLEGIYQNAVIVDPTACLSQFEGGGVFIKVSLKFVHTKGVDGLASSVLEILRDKGFFEGFAQLFEGLFRVGDAWVG